jgi:hypothetical protein
MLLRGLFPSTSFDRGSAGCYLYFCKKIDTPKRVVVEMALDLGIFAGAWILLALAALGFSVDSRDGDDWVRHYRW